MKKIYLLGFVLLSVLSFAQNFGSFASGVRVNSTIYNVTADAAIHQINPDVNAQNFAGANLGVFGINSTCARISASEVKTFKTAIGNVCGTTLFWRVYPSAAAPTGVFSSVNINNVIDCNTVSSTFNDGFGPCGLNDQKWKDYAINENFINGLSVGSYVLEIYFSYTGSNTSPVGCDATNFISNFGSNFKANFTVASPTCNPTVSATSLCEGTPLTLTANPSNGVAPYSYSWSGPNGFTSTAQNPAITTTLSNSGIYSLFVTDSCGAISAVQNTPEVTVIEKTIPTFDAIYPAICNGGTPPILPNLSTNGITGTWNPAVVSNTTTANYQFTPDEGQCATSFTQTIFVINNVTPTFSLPTSICQGATAPTLQNISNNGIQGTWNPTIVSNTTTGSYTYTPNTGQCAVTRTVTITVNPIVTPTFSIPTSICANATAPLLPTTSSNGINGTWSPSVVNNTTTGTYIFTHNASQCATNLSLTIVVNPNITPTFNAIAPICANATAPTLPATSNNGITGTWNPAQVSNTTSATYTFTPTAGSCATTTSLSVTVNPNITPTFNEIPPICFGSTPPTLPTTSNNGITGTWNPAIVSNTNAATYTFTPSANQCATTTSITTTINTINPVFSPVAPFCSGATAPILPTTSNNGITGTWNPATVSNTTSGTYTFTPNSNQCATTTTLSITVTPNVVPIFTAIAPICAGSTSPILPTTSNNGITGTWNPAMVSNTTSGSYTFTPNTGVCATITSLSVTVNPNVTPTFNAVAPICANATAPVLPTTSTNGISGTWNPATVSNTSSATYTFTPNAGLCATTTTLSVTVNPNVTPTFNEFPPICSGSTPPTLPTTSNNGIIGIWNPATVSNTTSGSYTFTPNVNQCATTASLFITVNPNITPTFTAIPDVCYQTTAPTLPTTSNNGIAGTWNPATVSNTSSGIYTFTPNSGQCATATSLNVTVITVIPTFDVITPICYNSSVPSLPTTSNNGIVGTWNPAIINNTEPGTYIFTPNANQCSTTVSVTTTIQTIAPSFTAIAPICYGSLAPVLQTTSNNGITGTWNPAVISNTEPGTYSFTPNTNQCATIVTITTTITTIVPIFNAIPTLCENDTAPVLPTISNNGISGTWNPTTINTTTSADYVFTPNPDQCATSVTISVTVNPKITPTFSDVAPVCYLSTPPTLPLTSNNGIAGTWNPALVSNTSSGTYTFTPNTGVCANTVAIQITVNTINPLFDAIADVCYGSTAPSLQTTSTNGITGTWNPAIVSNINSGNYTFTPDANQCATNTVITINVTAISPLFTSIAPLCENATAPVLPTTSLNGITGSWNPFPVNTTATGMYTFTPDANQCAIQNTITITVNPIIVPTFAALPEVCYNSVVPTLPTTSTNGISGTWNPATVSNTSSGTYTFTPSANECASETSLNVVVNTVVPTFNAISPFCENAVATILPATSTNGISGTWNPATISNTTSAVYNFTPNDNQCATTTTLAVIVNPNITPVFDAIAPVCFNSVAPLLPTTSNNGISGTWNPATISSTMPNTYTFTPNSDTCSTPITITTTITTIIPTFNAIADVCLGSTSPTLPATSTNGISGTWNPAVVSNTIPQSYTFTPDANQCATTSILTIGINSITPTFNAIADVCYESTPPLLPSSSTNGITGSWNPSVISNTVPQTYTFTPDVDQCATIATLSIGINSITPTFTAIAPLCENSVAPLLPTTSNNGISGSWNAAINTNNTTTYTFTPNPNQCATTALLTVIVTPKTLPLFNYLTSSTACQGFSTQVLIPTTSNNGISGSWNPNTIDYSNLGTTSYVFTPNANECATGTSFSITVVPNITPTFAPIAAICSGEAAPILPLVSLNGFSGTWNPANVNTSTSATYTFTPTVGQCATTAILSVTVNPSPTDLEFIVANVLNQTAQGTIEITNVVSGVSPFLYSINNGSYSSTTIYSNLLPGNYTVTVLDANGCKYEEIVTVETTCIFPKGISPNGDGKNDTFNLGGCNVTRIEFFNRYGKKINSFTNYSSQWDGTTDDGTSLPDGTYFYSAELLDGTTKTGWVYVAK